MCSNLSHYSLSRDVKEAVYRLMPLKHYITSRTKDTPRKSVACVVQSTTDFFLLQRVRQQEIASSVC